MRIVSQSSYSGPIPPPALLEEFERIAPGSAKQIIEQAFKQSDHRMGLENYVIRADNHRSWAGLFCGFTIAISFGGLSAWVILNGYPVSGSILGCLDLISLVALFVLGRKQQQDERQRKADIMNK